MFWETFKRLCQEHGTTPSNVAEAIGGGRSSTTQWKNGSVPQGKKLQKIADYFDVSVDYLLGKTDELPSKPSAESYAKRIPVVGDVAAGIPIEAIQEWDDWEDIDKRQFPAPEYIALKIHGDSMEPDIRNGDRVIVECGNPCRTGDYAIVIVNGSEATCKKIQFMPDGIRLISLNPDYGPMIYTSAQVQELPVRIFGKVVEVRRKF